MMNRIIMMCILVLGIQVQAFAQSHQYKDKYICDISVNENGNGTLQLGIDVLGEELPNEGGRWDQVDDRTATANVIELDVGGILSLNGMRAGSYYFRYTATSNSCLNSGDTRTAVIHIVPTPRNFTRKLYLCEGEKLQDLDLRTLIDPELTLVASSPFSLTNAPTSAVLSGDYYLTVPVDDLGPDGNLEITYRTETPALAPCGNTALINLNISVTNSIPEFYPNGKKIAYCQESMPETINLTSILGINATGGQWTALGGAPSPVGEELKLSNLSIDTDYIYEYSFNTSNCLASGNDGRERLTISVESDLSSSFSSNQMDICKADNPQGYIDLMPLLGISVPNSSGVWHVLAEASSVEIGDGIFELQDAKTGTYRYRYKIHSSSDICGLNDESRILTLNLFDGGEVLDAEAQVCAATDASVTFNLDDYMPNIPSGGSWERLSDQTKLTSAESAAYPVGNLDDGLNEFMYSFTAGTCGVGEAILYITKTDEITSFKDITMEFCLTDDGSDAIDIDAYVCGIIGLKGTVSFDGVSSVTGHYGNAFAPGGTYMTQDNVFNGKAAAEAEPATPGEGTYVFTFTANEDSCNIKAGDSIKITVIITEVLR